MTTVVLAGGGTAGHVNPLLATASELEARGISSVAVGSAGGLEEDLVPRAQVPLELIERVPFPRGPGMAVLRFPRQMRRAVARAAEIIEAADARAVVGFGGYVSTPVYLAARRLKVPIVVHEANARPGLANRLGAWYAAHVAVTFPGTALRGGVVTGLPLRSEIATLAADRRGPDRGRKARIAARRAFGWPEDVSAALIMGGSLGAARINEAAAESAESLVGHGLCLLHLTGKGKAAAAELVAGDLPAKTRRNYVVREYQHDMIEAFAAVDAVVCRSGAATVSEVSALGLPAIYVPLPIGNGEQTLNASSAVGVGGAEIVPDEQFTGAALRLGLERILLEPDVREAMETAAFDVGIVDGAARLADLVEKAIG